MADIARLKKKKLVFLFSLCWGPVGKVVPTMEQTEAAWPVDKTPWFQILHVIMWIRPRVLVRAWEIKEAWKLRFTNFKANQLCSPSPIPEGLVTWELPGKPTEHIRKPNTILFSPKEIVPACHIETISQFIGASRKGLVHPLLDSNNPAQNDENVYETKSPLLAQDSHLPVVIPQGIH